MNQIILDYFVNIYKSSSVDVENYLRDFQPRITAEQNKLLLTEYTEQEVKEALFAMH